jgi:hypothetical protein
MVKIMITNGGPHPADKWADITTDAILDLIQIEADSGHAGSDGGPHCQAGLAQCAVRHLQRSPRPGAEARARRTQGGEEVDRGGPSRHRPHQRPTT